MSEHLASIMDISDEVEGVSDAPIKSSDRMGSIMDMDYEEEEKESNEPGIDTNKEIPMNPKADPEEKTDIPKGKKEEPKEDKEDKEDKVEKEKVEEKSDKQKIKYKLDGQEIEEELTAEEISSAVSGRKAIQKRFTEIDQKNREIQKKEQDVSETVSYVKSEMAQIRDSFDKDIQEFAQNGFVKGNPIKSVYNLLDKMGLDASQFEKAVFFHHLPEVAGFLDMNDAERDSFLLGRENEWLRKSQGAIMEKSREVSEMKSKLEKENSVKRQAGISEELFSELKSELSAKGLENLTTDQVIEWHNVKPCFTRAESIAKMVPGSDVMKLAKILLEFPETTDEWMLDQLGYKQLQEKKIAESLKAKLPPRPKAKAASSIEDDEDAKMFVKQFRGR